MPLIVRVKSIEILNTNTGKNEQILVKAVNLKDDKG